MTVYKMVEVVGTSPESIEAAVNTAIERAAETVDDLRWFEILEQRGRIENGRVAEYQVKVVIGFHLKGT